MSSLCPVAIRTNSKDTHKLRMIFTGSAKFVILHCCRSSCMARYPKANGRGLNRTTQLTQFPFYLGLTTRVIIPPPSHTLCKEDLNIRQPASAERRNNQVKTTSSCTCTVCSCLVAPHCRTNCHSTLIGIVDRLILLESFKIAFTRSERG